MDRLMLLLCVFASTVFISYAGSVEKRSLEDDLLAESNLEKADVDQSVDPTKTPTENWLEEWKQMDNNEDKAESSKRVDGGWSEWGSWTSCSHTCGGGSQTRMRTCTNPPPSGGGAECQHGSSQSSQSCNMHVCTDCPEESTEYDQCGQRCTCIGGQLVKCVRIRKEFTTMAFEERARYIRTIKTASTDPRFKTDYANLLISHRELFYTVIHNHTHFLPWHRWFILQYENLLRLVNCTFVIAYWDWSAVSSDPFNTEDPSSLWYSGFDAGFDAGFGGDGTGDWSCVQTGPFSENEWSTVPPPESIPPCLTRNFHGNPPDTEAVELVLKTEAANFEDFEFMLRVNLHNRVHCLIDGTMCATNAAAAPEFFLHHGFIDKIWHDWQKKSEAHENVFFPTIDEYMPDTQLLPQAVIDLSAQPGGVIVEYRGHIGLISGKQKRRPFSPLSGKAFKLFHLTKSEIGEAKKFEKMLEPKN